MKILSKDFCMCVISIEETAVAFLLVNNLLDALQGADPWHRSDDVMQKKRNRGSGAKYLFRFFKTGCLCYS